ncbi:MAG: LysR family transcriptional regulator [Propionicimonas sp.]
MADRLNTEALRYAQLVAEASSFSAAARVCGVTQPALSSGIARLEERLGGRLFERSPRGVALTGFGERMLPMIDRALADLDAITAEARRLTEALSRSIRVGVSPLINPQLIGRAFTAARELPVPCDLVLREANMQDLRDSLLSDDLDLILIPAVAPLRGFEHRIIDAEPVVVVDSHQHAAEPVELAETVAGPLILVPDSCGLTTFTTQLFENHDLTLNPYPGEASSYRVLEQWASLGLGAAVLPLSKLSSPDAPHRPLRDDGDEVEIFYEAVWPRSTPLADNLRTLADRLAQASGLKP